MLLLASGPRLTKANPIAEKLGETMVLTRPTGCPFPNPLQNRPETMTNPNEVQAMIEGVCGGTSWRNKLVFLRFFLFLCCLLGAAIAYQITDKGTKSGRALLPLIGIPFGAFSLGCLFLAFLPATEEVWFWCG